MQNDYNTQLIYLFEQSMFAGCCYMSHNTVWKLYKLLVKIEI